MKTSKILSWLLLTFCLATTANATTYRLQRVTSVTAGNYYVFEQGGYVMRNSISSNALQTTSTFSTTGLSGSEDYVWELNDGCRLISANDSKYFNYDKSASNLKLSGSGNTDYYKWDFIFQEDGTAIIKNKGTGTYLSYMSTSDFRCKLFTQGNKPVTPYSFVVYQLVAEDGTKSRAGLKFDNLLVNCVKDENPTLPVLNTTEGFDGTITYSSSNEKVAMVDSETGAVTIVGAGRTLITASTEGTGTYDAGEATYTLLVKDGNGSTEKPYSINDFLSGYMVINNIVTVQGYLVGFYNSSSSFSSTADNDETVALSDTRDGATWDNTISVQLPSDKRSVYGLKTNPDQKGKRIIVTGKIEICQGKYGVSSSNDASLSSTYPVTITSYKYATYRTTETLDFSGTAVSAYTAEAGTDNVVLTKISDGRVPSGVGVILYSETAGTYDIPVTDDTPTVGDTGLSISNGTDATKENGIYVLGKKNDNVGFYRWIGGASLASGRVYLTPTASAREYLSFLFDDETAGINDVNHNHNVNDNHNDSDYHDLQGRRVAHPKSGLYIVNGKKVFIQ